MPLNFLSNFIHRYVNATTLKATYVHKHKTILEKHTQVTFLPSKPLPVQSKQ